jgi:hypothetical protein
MDRCLRCVTLGLALLLAVGSDAANNHTRGRRTVLARAEKAARKADKVPLVCGGQQIRSEVVYWRNVAGDSEYISPHAPKSNDDM